VATSNCFFLYLSRDLLHVRECVSKRVVANSIDIQLIKLDVQGYECKVLNGARVILQNVKSISVEADDRFLRTHGCGTLKLLNVLTTNGFNVSKQRTLTEDTFIGIRH
jgi:hypothetical protein